MTVATETRPLPIPAAAVRVSGGIWRALLERNRDRVLPAIGEQCRRTGRIDAFRLAWREGSDLPKPHIFWDSDVAKWIEAAAHVLAERRDPTLEAEIDAAVELIASAQQPDGYLGVYHTVVEPGKRFTNLCENHEIFCIGHLAEAAVAYDRATGKRRLVEIAERAFAHIATVFGTGTGQVRGYDGHEEVELALVALARHTGNPRWFALARSFVDERGQAPLFFAEEAARRGEGPGLPHYSSVDGLAYYQADRPVRDLTEAKGHAVRAMYLYCGMTDLAACTGDRGLLAALDRLWDSVTRRRMHVTGGVGARHHGESFGADFELPNASAYCETCANIGLALWAKRMLDLRGSGRYADALEHTLYNACLPGLSLDGDRFFYHNPLESRGEHHRQEWFGCACCPPNISRLIGSIGKYVYATTPGEVRIDLYVAAEIAVPGAALAIETNYPWDGQVRIAVRAPSAARFALRLRIPAWCDAPVLRVGDQQIACTAVDGYVRIERAWSDGDTITLDLPMSARRIYAHPAVQDDCGRVALVRGPILYCLEGVDNGPWLNDLTVPRSAEIRAEQRDDLLGGVVVLRLDGEATSAVPDELYATAPAGRAQRAITAVPYFAWDNRAHGPMLVWMREC
ncbi:MAG: glycoside hydrolase family 127 protein [Planctomycetes bacterium]|nr:glycoside hydrolase family 127 protein [Planctomycetota bacterium]